MNKNSNSYIIIYSTVMVVVVAALLAVASLSLQAVAGKHLLMLQSVPWQKKKKTWYLSCGDHTLKRKERLSTATNTWYSLCLLYTSRCV